MDGHTGFNKNLFESELIYRVMASIVFHNRAIASENVSKVYSYSALQGHYTTCKEESKMYVRSLGICAKKNNLPAWVSVLEGNIIIIIIIIIIIYCYGHILVGTKKSIYTQP